MKIPFSLVPLFALSLAFCLAPTPGHSQVIGSSGGGWSIRGTDPIQIFHGGELVTAYHSGFEAGKPYFHPVMGPTGENVTRHWPMKEGFEDEAQDHIHHRGMWYGLGRVNGLDFWHFHGDDKKRDREFGVIRHRGMNGVTISGDSLTFKTKSHWVAHADPERRVMSDRREFTLSYREDGALVVDTVITLVADAGQVTIQDDKEGAWSIRTAPTLRLEGEVAKGNIVNSEGVTGKPAWGKRAAWVDYYGEDRSGNSIGIAILDHPSNFRHPTWWHARHYGLFTANPFGQGHFEKDAPEDAGEHVIESGDSLTFRYRTIFHEGNAEEAGIAEAFEKFAAQE